MMLLEEKENYQIKTPNINPEIFKKLEDTYKTKISPEDIFYYVYGILYSNVYRKKYAEFLKIDFPRVPFTSDYKLG
jgi:predicted helicase